MADESLESGMVDDLTYRYVLTVGANEPSRLGDQDRVVVEDADIARPEIICLDWNKPRRTWCHTAAANYGHGHALHR